VGKEATEERIELKTCRAKSGKNMKALGNGFYFGADNTLLNPSLQETYYVKLSAV
jgi:hypothetical protein